MAKYAILQTFYASSKWRNFRLGLILERSKEHGGVICEDCGELITKQVDIHAHHKVELTPENVNDYSISLNPELVKLTHQTATIKNIIGLDISQLRKFI